MKNCMEISEFCGDLKAMTRFFFIHQTFLSCTSFNTLDLKIVRKNGC